MEENTMKKKIIAVLLSACMLVSADAIIKVDTEG